VVTAAERLKEGNPTLTVFSLCRDVVHDSSAIALIVLLTLAPATMMGETYFAELVVGVAPSVV
jgi:hypothetical protein